MMTIHNFIRRNIKSDTDFTCHEDENINLDLDDNYHNAVNLDQTQVVNVIYSPVFEIQYEMKLYKS